jgi:hypothetical protein
VAFDARCAVGKMSVMTAILALAHMSLTFRFIFVTLGLLCFIVGAIGWRANWARLELTAAGLAFITLAIWWWDLLADVINQN